MASMTSFVGNVAITTAAVQVGYSVIRLAPVAMTGPALAAVATGSVIINVGNVIRDRMEESYVRHGECNGSFRARGDSLEFERFRRSLDMPKRMLRTGVEAALGSVVFGLAGIKGILPVTSAFFAGVVGFPVATLAAAAVVLGALYLFDPILAG